MDWFSYRRIGLILGLFFYLSISPVKAQAARDYAAQVYNVDIEMTADGSILVTETIVFSFAGGPFTSVYRDLPTHFTDGIQISSVKMDGRGLLPGTTPGSVEITGGSNLRVTWHLLPTSNSVHTFTLSYRALGVIRKTNDADLFSWNAIPTQHDYPIEIATVFITYPETGKLLADPGLSRGEAAVKFEENQVIYRGRDLDPEEPLDLVIPFKLGTLISDPPQWQAEQWHRAVLIRSTTPIGLAAGMFVMLIGVAWLYLLWNRSRYESGSALINPITQSSPPDQHSPAITGMLTSSGARISSQHALGTLLDLACRGVIAIDEKGDQHSFGSNAFSIELKISYPELCNLEGLQSWEYGLLQALFKGPNEDRQRLMIDELSQAISTGWDQFAQPLEQQILEMGFIDQNRRRRGRQTTLVGAILLLTGLVASLVCLGLGPQVIEKSDSAFHFLVAALGIGVSLVLVGAGAILVGNKLPALTPRGSRTAAQWRSFSNYLRGIIRGHEPVNNLEMFESYLPYAASFGLAKAWTKVYRQHNEATAPAWFHPKANSNGDGKMAAFQAMVTASDVAVSSTSATIERGRFSRGGTRRTG